MNWLYELSDKSSADNEFFYMAWGGSLSRKWIGGNN